VESTELNISQSSELTWVDRTAKAWVIRACEKIQDGHLSISDANETLTFGEPRATASLKAHIDVKDPRAYKAFIIKGTVGAGEAFMEGAWTSPDLLAVVRIMVRNIHWLSRFNARRPWVYRMLMALILKLSANSRSGSKKNIAAHYDLGNDFFSLFLDPTLMYSSAIYPNQKATLEHASQFKLETICRKLALCKHDHLLEIGTGWGGMAIYAAQHYGCRVTTTTISEQQYAYAVEAVKRAGLTERVTVLKKDYRDLDGTYDKLVSIEMIEAVGYEYYKSYFNTCSRLLAPKGLMLIQAITIPDNRFHAARKSVDFIKRYIFPGGCLPSNEVMARCVARYTDMQVVDLHDITEHYAQTLSEWHHRFKVRLADVHRLGFDTTFCRMWEYYLRYCEGGFIERVIGTSQWLLAKPGYRTARLPCRFY